MVEEDELQEIVRAKRDEPRPPVLNFFIVALCAIAALPVLLAIWHGLYERFFEGTPPSILPISVPLGLGSNPATITLKVQDEGAGLDEVVVRLQQKKGPPKELLKLDLHGESSKDVIFELGGEGSGIDPGQTTVIVKAFDRSFWSNSTETSYTFKVDYRKPHAEIVTSMHNARIGGSQLAFYRAYDDDSYASGIKVGDRTFLGMPAKNIDPIFDDPTLRVALYAVDARDPLEVPVKQFAEDKVKNTFIGNFYNLVLPRHTRPLSVSLSTPKIDKIVQDDFSKISFQGLTPAAWQLPFLVPKGSIHYAYGDELVYKVQNGEIGRELLVGYEFKLTPGQREITSTHDGKVVWINKSHTFGYTIVVDHGLGLSSIYDRVETVSVKMGSTVLRGQTLGVAGIHGSNKVPDFYFEMRVQGVAVDAREWWESRWCEEHIAHKLFEMRKLLGLPQPVPPGESKTKKKERRTSRGRNH